MSISLPSAAVAVLGVRLRLDTAGFTNEDPDFPFDHLDAIQCGVFHVAMGTDFCLHVDWIKRVSSSSQREWQILRR